MRLNDESPRLRPVKSAPAENEVGAVSGTSGLECALSEIEKRFRRITGRDIVVTPAWRNARERKSALRKWATHPLCRSHAGATRCLRSRLAHARSLEHGDAVEYPSRHRCPFRNTCYLFPLFAHGELLGTCKLVFPSGEHPSIIRRYLETLEIIAENFLLRHGTGRAAGEHTQPARKVPSDVELLHPHVRLSIEHIDREFRNPDLTVDAIAQRFGINRDYLSHLFSVQVGHRMSRHIFEKRIDCARRLLESTPWQIKRIALQSGFLNTDWFSHLFHEHEGVTPTEFRRRHRRRRSAVVAE